MQDYSLIQQIMKKDFISDHFKKLKIKKDYFNKINKNTYIWNRELKEIMIELNIKYLDRFDYSCNLKKKECDFVTENEEKIYFDYGHYTLEGAKYFGKRIYEMNWLKF